MRSVSLLLAAFAATFSFIQPAPAAGPAPAELKLGAAQVKAMGITLAPLVPRNGGTLAGLPAQVVIPASQLHIVSAPLAGFVARIEVGTQQSVRRGQAMAQLQSPQLAELQRAHAQARAQAELAQRNQARDETLLAEGIIPESRALATRSQNAEAQAQLAGTRQALQLAGANAETKNNGAGSGLEIRSPIDGLVLEQLVQPGQRVEASAPLFKVARLDPLWLEIQVPAVQAAAIAPGAAVIARPAGMEAPVQGKVIAVGRVVSPGSQTVLVRAEVGDRAGRLQPGQLIEASIAVASNIRLFALPTEALSRAGRQAHVFVRTPTGFRAQPVLVSAEGAEETLVSGALAGDEQIAVRGIAALKAALMGIGAE